MYNSKTSHSNCTRIRHLAASAAVTVETVDPRFAALKELAEDVGRRVNVYDATRLPSVLEGLVEEFDELLTAASDAVEAAARLTVGPWPCREDYPESDVGESCYEQDSDAWSVAFRREIRSLWEKAGIGYAFFKAGLPASVSFFSFAAMARLDEEFAYAAMRELVYEDACKASGVDIYAEWRKAHNL